MQSRHLTQEPLIDALEDLMTGFVQVVVSKVTLLR